MTHAALQAWLDGYVETWRTYDEGAIGELFAAGATYRYHPWDAPLEGRDAIVASWLGDRDEPGSWAATYRPLVIEGDRAVATGETSYANGSVFDNVFLLAFDGEGRCSDFTEYYLQRPAA